MRTLLFVRALTLTNLKAAFALRGAFWLQVAFMVANNLIFWTVWLLFFRRFDQLNGWRLPEVTILYGVVAGAYGIVMVGAGGLRQLAQAIIDGDLDLYLTHPKSVILHVAGARSIASGWGDMLSCVVLLLVGGVTDPVRLGIAAVMIVIGAMVFASAMVCFHSLAFWSAGAGKLARELCDYIVMISVYPQTIYGGALRILLFTVLPAGFIGYLPVEAVRTGDARLMLFTGGAAVVYAVLARLIFRAGLKRYESGSRLQART